MTQSSLQGLDPDDTGPELLDFMFAWQEALHTTHSGATRPSYVKPGMLWLDTAATPWVLKMAGNGTLDIRVAEIDPSNLALDLPAQIAKRVRVDAAQTLSDAEKLQARSNIGAAKAAGWVARDPIVLTASATAIDIPVNGAKRMRLTPQIVTSTTSGDLNLQVSENGGSAFVSGAADYVGPRGFAVNGSTFSYLTAAGSPSIPLVGSTGNAAFTGQANVELVIGSSTRFFRAFADFFGNDSRFSFQSWRAVPAVTTHLRLFPSNGTLLAATNILIEDFFG